MKKIKVAFFAEILIEDFDGATRTMFQLIKRIDPQKFEYLFICGNGPERIMGFECFKIPAFTLPINTTYSMALPALLKFRMKEKLREFMPDMIHIATPSLLGNFALKYATQFQLPVISIYHTNFISYMDYYLKHAPFLIKKTKQIIADIQKAFYNQCDLVYVPSESMKTELLAMGVEPPRMKLWRRGIDTSLFSPQKKDVRMIQGLTGNEHPTILFASRLVWEKNLETLFQIYDKLQIISPQINFLIAGDGTARKACEARMKNAIFIGKVAHDTLSVLYASSTVFLFPSVSETYGNVVLEAMASGLPCVIANGGGSKDFIDEGISGFKCEACNAEDYIAKIRLLLDNKRLREHFSREGLEYSSGLDWNQLARVYFTDLTGMLNTRSLLKVV